MYVHLAIPLSMKSTAGAFRVTTEMHQCTGYLRGLKDILKSILNIFFSYAKLFFLPEIQQMNFMEIQLLKIVLTWAQVP